MILNSLINRYNHAKIKCIKQSQKLNLFVDFTATQTLCQNYFSRHWLHPKLKIKLIKIKNTHKNKHCVLGLANILFHLMKSK